ncbi:hypothetical protein Tco_1178638 [Tanacetum coccineum]
MCLWFSQLEQASNLFSIDERVTWVDFEGIPLKLVENILESFKIITQGKVFWVRAKEVSGWIHDFVEDDKEESDTDDEIRDEELHDESEGMHTHATVEGESDVEENDIRLEDPFNIYDLLYKKQDNIIGGSSSDNLKYPPGFTPTVATEDDKEESICSVHFKKAELPRSRGSMLQQMDDLVKVGQTMGYNMESCLKNIEEASGLEEVPLGGCSLKMVSQINYKDEQA